MRSVLIGAAAAAAALGAYGAWGEPRRIEVTRHRIALARWPRALDGFTLLHLTDLHTARWGVVEERVAALANGPVPDLLVATGDFAEKPDGLQPCLDALAAVPARHGRFAVLGNNDLKRRRRTRALVEGLSQQGFTVLQDRAERLTVDGHGFWVGGLSYPRLVHYEAYRYPVRELFAAAGDEPRLLLAHSPDPAVEADQEGVDLLLAGHTHGGQICLPGGIPLRNNLYRFPTPQLTRGLYRHGATTVYVSRGLGMTQPSLRLWSRPEIAWLELVGDAGEKPQRRGGYGARRSTPSTPASPNRI